MKYDVFISYKRQSLNIVKAIVHILDNEGINCWYDSGLDENAGRDYSDIIAENITNSRMVIVILSNAAVESEWVKAEVMSALDQKKLVIPFVVAELQVKNGLTMRLSGKHWIDAYPNPDRKFALLLKNVKLALNELSGQENEFQQEIQRFDIEEDYTTDFDYDEGEALYQAKEYNEAALAFLASAERGNQKAKDALCQLFYDQENDIMSFDEEIWSEIEQQARIGHCYANFLMHCKLYKDASNNLVAFEYLKKSISKNSIPLAFLRMGIQYNWGMGVKQSHTLGMHYYNKALNIGCKEAYSYIAQEYRWGNDKIKKDVNKAIDLFTKGIEEGDKRSYKFLAQLYLFDLKQKEKAIEIAQKAIDINYSKGYSLMGDIALGDGDVFEQDSDEAIKWYKKALLHDEKEAYGMLAWLYNNEGETEEALRMAKRGRMVRDSSSFGFLGWYYENNEELDNAWQCYKEQYDLFGIGADSLAKLVIEKGFFPKGVETDDEKRQFLDQLEQLVEVQARNGNEECLNALLKFYSYKEKGTYDIDYSIGQRIPKAFEIIRLGAEIGISEMMYYLGKGMMDDQQAKNYNPLKGLEWISKATEQGYASAIEELLSIYYEGIWEDKDEYRKTVITAIRNRSFDNKKLMDYLSKVTFTEDAEYETAKHFIENIMQNDNDTEIKVRAASFFLKTLNPQSDDAILDDIRKMTESFFDKEDYGFIRQIGLPLLICYPEYDRSLGLKDYFNGIDSNNAKLFYALFDDSCMKFEIDIKQQDEVLALLFKQVQNDVALEEFTKIGLTENLGASKDFLSAQDNFSISYKALCDKYHVDSCQFRSISYKDSIPYVMSSRAIDVWKDMLNCIHTLSTDIPIISEILNNKKTSEEILNMAEKENDQNLQLLLIEIVELAIEIDSVLINNCNIYQQFQNQKYDVVAEQINKFVDIVNSSGIEHTLKSYTKEDIHQLYEQSSSKNQSNESDDFEKLLQDFINQK